MDKQIIPLVYDSDMMKLRNEIYVHWDITSNPHMAIQGITGTGKSYLCKLILGRVGLYLPTGEITICDFKKDDSFIFLEGCKRYHRFEACMNGFDTFYDGFLQRQAGLDNSRNLRLIMFDEWASFLQYLDKKKAEEYRKMLSTILMMGRIFNYQYYYPNRFYMPKIFRRLAKILALLLLLVTLAKLYLIWYMKTLAKK